MHEAKLTDQWFFCLIDMHFQNIMMQNFTHTGASQDR